MSSNAQIEANRQNAQASTGATSPAGQKKSSMNALRHGFTGQSVLVSAEEKPLYDAHVIAYLEQYQPKSHEESNLIQQYADQHWTLHQISVQQMNVLTMLNMSNAHHMKIGSDYETLNAASAQFYKQIGNLGIYEQRRRRAAQETLAQFNELKAAREKAFAEAVTVYKGLKLKNQPFNPADFGFVYSTAEIETFVARQAAIFTAKTPVNQPVRA